MSRNTRSRVELILVALAIFGIVYLVALLERRAEFPCPLPGDVGEELIVRLVADADGMLVAECSYRIYEAQYFV